MTEDEDSGSRVRLRGDPGRPVRIRMVPALPARYQDPRRLAAGGMATVYAAQDTLLGRQVAIKVLHPHVIGDADARERFAREARAAARLSDHPHVVTIYDIGESEGTPFIVMELLAGG